MRRVHRRLGTMSEGLPSLIVLLLLFFFNLFFISFESYVFRQTWDDVERKTKQVDTPFEYKKRVVLDQEKSKLSLGEIYEAEFVKQTQTDDGEVKVGNIIIHY